MQSWNRHTAAPVYAGTQCVCKQSSLEASATSYLLNGLPVLVG